MNKTLAAWLQKFDALSLRERLMVAAAAFAATWQGNPLLVEPTAQIRVNQTLHHLPNSIHKEFVVYGCLFERYPA